ncbi:hypothetical protein AVEN_254343-1 [Araneus ventricosus]|uniref:Uncharacterized protein n=1 Tax=Araneus ventricosus TaxID=182803 RepID=A0A4Y2M1I6_ARAVE|nr:hypothetical protein AVEN_254343-1 [Araneus ventricosus]
MEGNANCFLAEALTTASSMQGLLIFFTCISAARSSAAKKPGEECPPDFVQKSSQCCSEMEIYLFTSHVDPLTHWEFGLSVNRRKQRGRIIGESSQQHSHRHIPDRKRLLLALQVVRSYRQLKIFFSEVVSKYVDEVIEDIENGDGNCTCTVQSFGL